MTPTDLKHMHDAEMQGSEAYELKPCPFCGGEARLEADHEHSTAFTLQHHSNGCPIDDLWDWYPDPVEAVSAWNTRADRAAFEQMREALKALEREASNTIRIGAQTGPHWTKLSVANLRARAALKAAEESK